MARTRGRNERIAEIAEILVNGYLSLRSKEDSPPDRQESLETRQIEGSAPIIELNAVRSRGMDCEAKTGHPPPPSKELN